jgi:putative phosphoesterase
MNTPECSFNRSYCKYGAEAILQLLDGFEDLVGGVIENTDVECVHKTRVGSRRLRATMPLFDFCYPKKDFKQWTKEVKKVTKLLSEARDLDVQIAFVEQYLEKLGPDKDSACVDRILKEHKSSRKKIQTDVEDGLEKLLSDKILRDIQSRSQQIIAQQANQPFDKGQVLEKAHWHITCRLNDFLSMKQYVYMEKEKLKLHQMRIYAKKLRYTMECFSKQYSDQLEGEIGCVKTFQDTLGDMHDCDIWLDYLPQFTKSQNGKLSAAEKRALQKFTAYLEDKRKKHYCQFVEHWEKCLKTDFFNQLTDLTNSAVINVVSAKIKKALAKPHLKMAVISDVHANLEALQKVLEDVKSRGADIFVNAGDSIGFGACPNEAIALLCENNVLGIVGNYDTEVLEGRSDAKGEKKISFKFTEKELSQSSECYLHLLPHELRLEVAGKKLLITHGSPKSIEEHIYHHTPEANLEELAQAADADVVVVGHSHEQFRRQAGDTCFINPGSVGRQGDGNPKAAYAMLSFDPFKVELIRLDYNVEGAAEELRKRGLPESFAQMLLEGVALDEVVKQDKAKEAIIDKTCSIAVEASRRFSAKLLPDAAHYGQVANVALALFDSLQKTHRLGKRERCWLECAALLHDVGLSKGTAKHHKTAMQLILNDTELPFPSRYRRIIASIARYHRKALPKPSHYNLQPLDKETVHNISVLSGILRIADALDYSHENSVVDLAVDIGAQKITIKCVAQADLTLEEQAFDKKKNLFEQVFGKKTVLVWKQQ